MEKIKFYIIIAALLLVGKVLVMHRIQTMNSQVYLEMAARNNPEVKADFNQYLASTGKSASGRCIA